MGHRVCWSWPFLLTCLALLAWGSFFLLDHYDLATSLSGLPQGRRACRTSEAAEDPHALADSPTTLGLWSALASHSGEGSNQGIGASSFQVSVGGTSPSTAGQRGGFHNATSAAASVEVRSVPTDVWKKGRLLSHLRWALDECGREWRTVTKSFATYCPLAAGGSVAIRLGTLARAGILHAQGALAETFQAGKGTAGTQRFERRQGSWERQRQAQGKRQAGCPTSYAHCPNVNRLTWRSLASCCRLAEGYSGISRFRSLRGKAVLQALAPLLGQMEGLPQQLRDQISSIAESEHGLESQALHSLVRRRTKAKAELAKIQAERAQFENAWASYMEQLQTLLQKQFTQRTTALEEFAKAESEWRATLQDSSTSLLRPAETASQPMPVDLGSDMETEDAVILDPAVPAVNMDEIRAGQQNLLTALQSVQAAALQGARRDGSRTPRRGKTGDGGGDQHAGSSPDPWKSAPTDSKVVPVKDVASDKKDGKDRPSKALQPFGKPQT